MNDDFKLTRGSLTKSNLQTPRYSLLLQEECRRIHRRNSIQTLRRASFCLVLSLAEIPSSARRHRQSQSKLNSKISEKSFSKSLFYFKIERKEKMLRKKFVSCKSKLFVMHANEREVSNNISF